MCSRRDVYPTNAIDATRFEADEGARGSARRFICAAILRVGCSRRRRDRGTGMVLLCGDFGGFVRRRRSTSRSGAPARGRRGRVAKRGCGRRRREWCARAALVRGAFFGLAGVSRAAFWLPECRCSPSAFEGLGLDFSGWELQWQSEAGLGRS